MQSPGIVTRKSKIFLRISPQKGKKIQKYFGMMIWAYMHYRFMKITRARKSHATVPLIPILLIFKIHKQGTFEAFENHLRF